jgi:hypothetical protein
MPLKARRDRGAFTMPELRCMELSLFGLRIVARSNRGPDLRRKRIDGSSVAETATRVWPTSPAERVDG